jgi:hypothetical protein
VHWTLSMVMHRQVIKLPPLLFTAATCTTIMLQPYVASVGCTPFLVCLSSNFKASTTATFSL